jgi:hypothetical protein
MHSLETTTSNERRRFGSTAARDLLERHGLMSLDRLFELQRAIPSRHDRCVFPWMLADAAGQPVRVYIKLNWGRRRLWPRMNDLKSGQVFQTLPVREWRGIERVEQLGIGAPERLGLFESRGWSLSFRAAIVVREVPPPASVDAMLQSGAWHALAPRQQGAILDAMVATLHRLHAARLGWRGSSSRHFYPLERPDSSYAMWLIDCEGIHPFAGRRTFDRNFDKLRRAMRESGADAGTLERLQERVPARRAA